MTDRSAHWYDPFDPSYVRGLIEGPVGAAIDHYFRPRLIGAERLPRHGPALLAPNHSGTAFPYDAMVFDALVWRHHGFDPARKTRVIFEKELAQAWWMRPFGIDNFWRRGGGVDATFDNFERLFARGDVVGYYPEGVPGIGKGFWKRYRLQRFSSSFVVHCARHDVPYHPVHIVNAEWVIPFNFTLRSVDRLVQRLFHVPFLPLPAAPLAIVFPWMWYLSMPARMTFVVGEPIDVAALCREEGLGQCESLDAEGRARARRVAARVRSLQQEGLDRAVTAWGGRPYEVGSLIRELMRSLRRWRSVLPPGWPTTWLPWHRDRERRPARNRLHALLRDWDVLGFYLPLGWFLLAAARELRRPPYGYRGLTRRERREREGTFHWHLRERPLPPRG